MKLHIYKDGKLIKEVNGVDAHGFKTMYLGRPLRQVLMFTHKKHNTQFSGSVDLLDGMTFDLYKEKKEGN